MYLIKTKKGRLDYFCFYIDYYNGVGAMKWKPSLCEKGLATKFKLKLHAEEFLGWIQNKDWAVEIVKE